MSCCDRSCGRVNLFHQAALSWGIADGEIIVFSAVNPELLRVVSLKAWILSACIASHASPTAYVTLRMMMQDESCLHDVGRFAYRPNELRDELSCPQ